MSAEQHIHGGLVDSITVLDDLVTAMSNAFAGQEDFERFGACLVLMKGMKPEEAGALMVCLQETYERAVELLASTSGGRSGKL